MKLSIIIPVFNTADTIVPCVRSAMPRKVADWEIILVDDGSTDASPQICDDLAAQDSRISVIHQPNAGLSEARNAGIGVARGELLAFVDSDDTIEPETFDMAVDLMDRHADYDILEFPVSVHHGAPDQHDLNFQEQVYYSAADYWIDAQAYRHAYAWNKVYRRHLFDDVRYPAGRYFEDVFILPLLLRRARAVATTFRGRYHYNYNPQSITANLDGARLTDLLEAHDHVLRNEQWLLRGKHFGAYYTHVLNIQLDVSRLTGQPVLTIPLSPYCNTPKLFLLRLAGYKTFSRCHTLLHNLRKPFK